MGIPSNFGRDVPLKLSPRPAVLAQCALCGASGTGVSSRLSRVCVMCSLKGMSRPYLDSLSGDVQGWDIARPLLCWSGGSWRWSEMLRVRHPL